MSCLNPGFSSHLVTACLGAPKTHWILNMIVALCVCRWHFVACHGMMTTIQLVSTSTYSNRFHADCTSTPCLHNISSRHAILLHIHPHSLFASPELLPFALGRKWLDGQLGVCYLEHSGGESWPVQKETDVHNSQGCQLHVFQCSQEKQASPWKRPCPSNKFEPSFCGFLVGISKLIQQCSIRWLCSSSLCIVDAIWV